MSFKMVKLHIDGVVESVTVWVYSTSRQEQERHMAKARAASQAHPSQEGDPRGYPRQGADTRDPRDLRDPYPG